MTSHDAHQSAFPYQPESIEVFKRYAKDLAWLINEPLQRTQNILASIYGYANYHAIQIALKTKPESKSQNDDTSFQHVVARSNRILEVLKQHRGGKLINLSKRDWDAREIGLFESPARHRRLFNKIKQKYLVLLSEETSGVHFSVHDYAEIELRDNGECFLVFTQMGRSIFDAVESLLPNAHRATIDDYHRAIEAIEKIIAKHPNNPWPYAMLINAYGDLYWLGQWDLQWDSEICPFDAQDGYRTNAKHFAYEHYDRVKKAIQLFDEMYCGHALKAPVSKMISGHYTYGTDCYYWPALLYWGGRIAMHAGKWKDAYTWFSQHHKINTYDSFGVRYQLAMLRLVRGKGSVAALFPRLEGKEPNISIMSCLARAAEAHRKEQYDIAKRQYAEALCMSWAAAEPFSGREKELAKLPVNTNIKTPAHVQEFMYWTQSFWAEHPDTFEFFRKIASNAAVKKAMRLCYSREASIPNPHNSTDPAIWSKRSQFYRHPGGEFEQLKTRIKQAVMKAC